MMAVMRYAVCALAVLLAPAPLAAQEATPFDEGIRGMIEQFRRDIDPLLRDFEREVEPRLRGLSEDFLPLLETLGELMGDYESYHRPETLPNGDIIIRRKTPLPAEPSPEPPQPQAPRSEPSIEL